MANPKTYRFTVQFTLGIRIVSEIAFVSWTIPPLDCICVDSPDFQTAEIRRNRWLNKE